MRFLRSLATAFVALAVGLVPLAAAPVADAHQGGPGEHPRHGNPLPVVQGEKPTITGDATLGATLTVVPGAWSPADVTLTYRWFRGHGPVEGATGETYTLTDPDVGKRIWVVVTGAKDGYRSASRRSAPTDKVTAPALTTAEPTITGTVQVGEMLTADPGAWGPDGVALTYQWYRAGHRIPGATESTYTLVGRDWHQRITVKVTGQLTGYATASRKSQPTDRVAAGVLTLTPVPTITGTPVVGEELTADAGTWGPGTVHLTYQWYRSGEKIRHANRSQYVLRDADLGATITVSVTGWKFGYAPVTQLSDPTATVA